MNPNPKNQFGKGNKAALGNDKTLRLSTWLDKKLDEPIDIEGYDKTITFRQAMSQDMVHQYFKATEPLIKKQIFDTIADRTEGKPKQTNQLQNPDGSAVFEKVTFSITHDN